MAQEGFREFGEWRCLSEPDLYRGLYNYGLFFTFFVAGSAYLALSMIGGREVTEELEGRREKAAGI